MTLRTLLVALIVLLAANMVLAIWNRMAPPEASIAESAFAPAPLPCSLSHYDHPAAVLAPPYKNLGEPALFAPAPGGEDGVAGSVRGAAVDTVFVPTLDPPSVCEPPLAVVADGGADADGGAGADADADGDADGDGDGDADGGAAAIHVRSPEVAPADTRPAVSSSSSDTLAVVERWTIARIVDGDTFVLSDSTRVRLIGIDTPEPRPRDSDVERTGKDKETLRALALRATAYASELALGKPVELEYGSGRRTDWYGRTLAYVWVLDEQGQRLYRVNDRLIADGYANIYSRAPFEYMEKYREYERQAREAGRGLWGD